MKIAFCTAEVAPFSQAGGLGDVTGSLPRALDALGLECVIVTPLYRFIDPERYGLKLLDTAFHIDHDWQRYPIAVWEGKLPRSNVPVYFIDNQELFGRDQVYPYGQIEYELRGFRVFSKAFMALLHALHLRPDVIHAHDWHTATVCKYLGESRAWGHEFFAHTRSVLTIHNLQYQGMLEDGNELRDGIIEADAITTVSPNYAQEIQTPDYGAGLDGLLREHHKKISGVLNGIDTTLYDPKTDAFITKHYDADTFVQGKAACKEALQMALGLPVDPDVPLIGFVGRLTPQKGLDLMIPVMERMAAEAGETPVQWAVIGSGDGWMEDWLRHLNTTQTHLRSYIGFNAAIAQQIYAGADMFVMPSRFEPCGLGQLIALRYGAVPVVRGVGGLLDTVCDVRDNPEEANGFVFQEYSQEALYQAIRAAMDLYRQKDCWQALIRRGMEIDHGWEPSAAAYRKLYERLAMQEVRPS